MAYSGDGIPANVVETARTPLTFILGGIDMPKQEIAMLNYLSAKYQIENVSRETVHPAPAAPPVAHYPQQSGGSSTAPEYGMSAHELYINSQNTSAPSPQYGVGGDLQQMLQQMEQRIMGAVQQNNINTMQQPNVGMQTSDDVLANILNPTELMPNNELKPIVPQGLGGK